MPAIRPGRRNAFLLAVAAVAVAFGLRWSLTPLIGPRAAPLQLFFLAIFVAARGGGLYPGLLATALSVAVAYPFFVGWPDGSLVPSLATFLTTLIFVVIGVIVSVLSDHRLRALEREAEQRQELEQEKARRAAADAMLVDERNRLRVVSDQLPILIANCDREQRFKFVNRAYAERLNLEPQDFVSRTVTDVLGAELAGMIQPYVERVLAGESVEYEITAPYPRIGPQRIRCAYAPERDAEGRIVGWIAALTNVTDAWRAESQRRYFASLVENASDFIGISDLDYKPLYVNPAAARLVGLENPENTEGLSVLDFFYPEDRAQMATEFFPRVLREGHAECEIRFRNFSTGQPLWIAYHVVRLDDPDGQPTGFATISRDLTERKRSEDLLAASRERLRAALDASATGTFRWDFQTNELEWDENLDRLFGLAPGRTARSLPEFIRLVHPQDRERVLAACGRCAQRGEDFEEEFRVVFPDSTVRWLYDKGRTHFTEDGRPHYLTGACVDVTERREKEEALRAADRQKDEFLGMLAHELRNPLAPILYSVNLLERLGPEPAARRPLEIIARQARRMTRLVDDLLDVSRVTEGKISLDRKPLDLVSVASQAADAMRPMMESRAHTFEVKMPREPLPLVGDAARLGQVLENLLSNAAKYTPNGGRVSIELRAEGDRAVVSVADTGVGINPEMLPRVFDLFVQADTSLDRAEGGLGIGLTLVDRLVRMHGGSVEARSGGLGEGSEFVLRLPLARAGDYAAHQAGSLPGAPPPRRRYLIVDDNEDSAEALKLLLQMRGHEVHQVHDGPAALHAALSFRPDVVLLDVGLPGMDGFEVVRALRNTPETASVLVIAATGYGREEDRLRCLAAGFDHHLAKPIDVNEVETVVSSR